jgi:predicted nucleic acid-binding protein
MMAIPRVYWDSSCFISLLSSQHQQESERALICADVLKHAQNDDIQIWTSVWTIVETIRPKEEYKPLPLPIWSNALKLTDKNGNFQYPTALSELEKYWNYFNRHTMPSRVLSQDQAKKIQGMFAWPFIKMVQIVPTIAEEAAEIARTHNMKAADSIHVASALAVKCGVIHRWDRDFKKTDALISSEEPKRMSAQTLLPGIVPPSDPTSFTLS